MKPLLRTLLAINAVIVLLLGVFFVLTPWLSLYAPVAGLASSPALIGQLLGVLLLGSAGLQANAVGNGRLTAGVARWSGHTLWIAAAVLLVWTIALRQPALDRSIVYAVPFAGIVLLLLGIIQARLGGAVAARERRERIGEASARRAEIKARREGVTQANTAVAPASVAAVPSLHGDGEPYMDRPTVTPAAATVGAPQRSRVDVADPSDPRLYRGGAGGTGVLDETQAASRAEDERRGSAPPSF